MARPSPHLEAHTTRVNRVMDHVREHLDGDLSVDALARVAGRSPFHFHRLFKAITGETVTTFVQRARLERAAYLMMSSPARRLDSIALEVGFSAHSVFTRVFKKRYGIAPSDWDRKSRLDSERVVDDFDDIVAKARTQGPPPEIRVVDQPARQVAYVRTNTPFVGARLQVGYQRLIGFLEGHGVDWRTQALLGWSWDNHETTPLERVHYDFGFTVPEPLEHRLRAAATQESSGVGFHGFPAHRAVQARCQGPLLDIAVAWETLFEDWLPSSPYETDDLPGIKVFCRRPDELGWDTYDLWCSLAIRPITP